MINNNALCNKNKSENFCSCIHHVSDDAILQQKLYNLSYLEMIIENICEGYLSA